MLLLRRPPTPIHVPARGTPTAPGPLLPTLVAMLRHPVILNPLSTFVLLLLLASVVRAVVIPTHSSTVLTLMGGVVGVLARVAWVVSPRPPVMMLLVLEYTEGRRRGVVEVRQRAIARKLGRLRLRKLRRRSSQTPSNEGMQETGSRNGGG